MSTNPIKARTGDGKKEKSPLDPQECCDWANARLRDAGDFDREWRVTGDKDRPIALIRLVA